MLRTFGKTILILSAATLIFYTIPDNLKTAVKDRALALISQVAPDNPREIIKTQQEKLKNQISEKINPFVNTPIERRAKLLAQLEANIQNIKTQIAAGNQPALPKPDGATSTEGTSAGDSEAPTRPSPEAGALLQKLDDALATVKKIEETNTDQGLISAVANKIISQSSTPAPNPAPAPNCSWVCQSP